ncbi:uncharacterized protein LOC135937814 isoform X1 [Cloeon dipterum]|uniref:uncharacterized protein LOC135937814 isoform X1 n=2 Tax=Cloeon dipterum TaxID=197152 RepID=UPI003220A089
MDGKQSENARDAANHRSVHSSSRGAVVRSPLTMWRFEKLRRGPGLPRRHAPALPAAALREWRAAGVLSDVELGGAGGMLRRLSPPVCCSPLSAAQSNLIMVSPPPQFAAGAKSPPKHFIWPEVRRPSQLPQAKHPQHHRPISANNAVLSNGLGNNNLVNSNNNNNTNCGSNKRKSAVELLQESKAYYVKSEHVLDAKQVLRAGVHGGHLRSAPLPPRQKASHQHHQRTVSLDKAAFLENTPPRLPERSCSQSPPPLPPKSPRIAPGRPRARTLVLTGGRRPVANGPDVQMRLRQLLSQPSLDRDNTYRRLSEDDHPTSSLLRSRHSHDDDEDEIWLQDDDSSAFESKSVGGEKGFPVSSRHSTPSAAGHCFLSPAATHKSLPDLSPGAAVGSTPDDNASTGSSSKRCYYAGSRATSDYVSRSPSSCKCCESRARSSASSSRAEAISQVNGREQQEEDEGERDELLSPDTDDSLSRRPRPVLRSKSDISHRYSRSAAFLAPIPRTELDDQPLKTTVEVEHFFENLGLEEHVFRNLTRRSSQESSIFFGSVSSVDSWPGGGTGAFASSSVEEEVAVGPGGGKMGEQPSIVERNARIIKWLCNCRKAALS